MVAGRARRAEIRRQIGGPNKTSAVIANTVAEIGWGQSILDLSDNEADVRMGVVGRIIHSDYLLKADGFDCIRIG